MLFSTAVLLMGFLEALPVPFVRCQSTTGSGSDQTQASSDDTYPSPDGRFQVVWETTPGLTRQITLKDAYNNSYQIDYPKPGDNIPRTYPRLYDSEGQRVSVSEDLYSNPFDLIDLGWSGDSHGYRFIYNERGHKVFRVVEIGIDGSARSLIEETSDTSIDYNEKTYFHFIEDSEMLWQSERDGWNHLYLFDLEKGSLKNQVTSGQWNVRSVDRVDEGNRQIFFRVMGAVPGQDPYYEHLARINFDGTDFKILTAEADGTHTWEWTPGNQTFRDTWQRIDLAPQSVLRDLDGQILQRYDTGTQTTDPSVLPERFSAPGRDGKTLIYGIIVKPTNFDPNKKYPVIEEIYASPGGFNVPKTYSSELHPLADLGFVEVQIDGMGTNWRGKAFQDVAYKNLKDAGFPDRIAWFKAAAETRPWMDLTRVGIFGGSAGGQNALGALIWHSDFYKAAIADAGCHDNRMDKIWWNEQWMGWPVDQSYADSSNIVHADKMNGALMLTVGSADDNVDPASTYDLVDALRKAGKEFDYVRVPGGGHVVIPDSEDLTKRSHDFWMRHLM